MRKIFATTFAAALFFCSTATYANEAFVNWAGGTFGSDAENPQVSMISEVVEIALGKDSYTVDASFIFMNDGEDVDIPVSFPTSRGAVLYSDTILSPETPITELKTWVDGKECTFAESRTTLKYFAKEKWTTLTAKEEIETFKKTAMQRPEEERPLQFEEWRWDVKSVHFAAKQQTTTRVQYRAPYGEMGDERLKLANYIFGSGRTWKGTIGSAKFVIRSIPGLWMWSFPSISHPYKWSRNGEREYVLEMSDFEPNEDDALTFDVSSGELPTLEYGIFDESVNPLNEEALSLWTEEHCLGLANAIFEWEKAAAESERANGTKDVPEVTREGVQERWGRKIEMAGKYIKKAKEIGFKYPIKTSLIGDW